MKLGIVGKRTGLRLAVAAGLAGLLSIGATGLVLGMSLSASGCAGSSASDESAGPVTRLTQNHPTNVDLKHDLPVPRDKVLTMQVDFALRNPAEFDELSREIDDKKSPHYHQWLTPELIHQRFGETAGQYQAVAQWLMSQGFTITEKRYNESQDFIKFKGTALQAETAFKIKLVEPQYDRYINSKDPAIPDQFAGVISRVEGLYGLLQ
jgi:subtilase family serine protease